MDVHLAVEASPEDVLADEPGGPGLGQLGLEDLLYVVELAPDVDVGRLGSDGVAADEAPLNEQVRVPLHEHVVLERARLALVGVAADVPGLGRLFVDELPLEPRGEPGAAAAPEARLFD